MLRAFLDPRWSTRLEGEPRIRKLARGCLVTSVKRLAGSKTYYEGLDGVKGRKMVEILAGG